MKVHRISRAKYISDLSGTGAKLHGGRWNPKGYALLYTSENKALAALEVLVHLTPLTVPNDLKILTLEISQKELIEFDKRKFKEINQQKNAVSLCQKEGKDWVDTNNSLGLIVPSILIPGEHNILINPLHSSFRKIDVLEIEDFNFDKRFF